MCKSESLTCIIQFQQKLCISALCSSLKLSLEATIIRSPGLIIHGTPSTIMVMRGLTLKVPSLRNPADLMQHLHASVTIGLIGICMAHHIFLSTAGYVLVVWNRDRHRSLVSVVAVGVSRRLVALLPPLLSEVRDRDDRQSELAASLLDEIYHKLVCGPFNINVIPRYDKKRKNSL